MAESVHHLSTLVNWGISASSAQHLEQYLKVVGCWRHSQQAIQPSTWSGASSYLAPTFAELVPDSTWTGTTDRLPYSSASGAQHLEQYKKVVGRWRHSQQAIQLRFPEFIFGAD